MSSAVVGRGAELAAIEEVLETVRRVPVAGGVRMWGRSGIGKTTLLSTVEVRASEREWVVLSTACHQIQSQMPLVAVKRLIRGLSERLGDDASRYSLETRSDSAENIDAEHALYRMLEGVVVDYSVLLCIDDAQWIDSESERVVSQALRILAASRLGLVVAGRGESSVFDDLGLTPVPLGRLSDEATDELVREIVSPGHDDVVRAIVAHAAGVPLTASVLAKEVRSAKISGPDDVPASMRAVVAHLVNQMKPQQREFLQLCSLVEDPIEYRVVRNLYESAAIADELVRSCVPSFLNYDGLVIRFAHSSIAEGVRQTIPVDVPYRRRVLQALRDVEAPSLGDRERMVRQAAACGDRVLERSTLVELARAASMEGALLTACDAYRRAMEREQPPSASYVDEYSEYGMALIACDLYNDAYEVLDLAVRGATARGMREGIGALVAALMLSSWYAERGEAFWALFDRYIPLVETANDRAALLAAASMFHAFVGNDSKVREFKDTVLALPGDVAANSLSRVFQAEAVAELRAGRYEEARASVRAASARVDESRPDQRFLLESMRSFIDLAEFGVSGMMERLPFIDAELPGGHVNPYRLYLEAFALVARGDFGEASLLVERTVMRGASRQTICRILGIDAAIAVLGGRAAQYETLTEAETRVLPNRVNDSVSDSAVGMATWWAVLAVEARLDEARRVIESVLPRIRRGFDPSVLYLPEPLALYAARAKDTELLEEIADRQETAWSTRWDRAHQALARAIAADALGRPESRAALAACAKEMSDLGAGTFAALATDARNPIAAASRSGEKAARSTPATLRASRPTARERQIVQLVADGLSNRLIAERLVLSERTVEAHLANVFAKAGVSSRVQLAALAVRGEFL